MALNSTGHVRFRLSRRRALVTCSKSRRYVRRLCRNRYRTDHCKTLWAGGLEFRTSARILREPSVPEPRQPQNRQRGSQCAQVSSDDHIGEYRRTPAQASPAVSNIAASSASRAPAPFRATN